MVPAALIGAFKRRTTASLRRTKHPARHALEESPFARATMSSTGAPAIPPPSVTVTAKNLFGGKPKICLVGSASCASPLAPPYPHAAGGLRTGAVGAAAPAGAGRRSQGEHMHAASRLCHPPHICHRQGPPLPLCPPPGILISDAVSSRKRDAEDVGGTPGRPSSSPAIGAP
jgi:hypothetical protein